jgi:PPE-repeat protein
MTFAMFPPEVNSGRMYAGPGAAPILAAAQAWTGLAAELQSAVTACSSTIEGLTSSAWTGPASVALLGATHPYLAWMQQTAVQATEAATQATDAAQAFEIAFTSHVPPEVVAANRDQLALLLATNAFGQNSMAIGETEAEYSDMWLTDAAAMDAYAASSASATRVTPFKEPPQVANVGAPATQAAAVATSTGGSQSLLSSILSGPDAILAALAQLSTEYSDAVPELINALFGPGATTSFEAVYNAVKGVVGFTTQANSISAIINLAVSSGIKAPTPFGIAALSAIPKVALGAGLGLRSAAAVGAVSAATGSAGLVGALSVPPAWASATPAIRTVAAALSASGPEAVPAAALSQAGLLGSMSVAGMLGSAFGAGAPSALSHNGARSRLAALKDLKGIDSEDGLRHLVAQIAEKPETVQHHTVDQEGLDALLEQLSAKPGVHAVHLSKKDKSKVLPPDVKFAR